MITDKKEFLFKANRTVEEIYNKINASKPIELSSLEYKNTALIIVDMVNGFVKSGILSSPRISKINVPIADFSKVCLENNIDRLIFADTHSNDSEEFKFYPPHCIKDTEESKVTEEIANIKGYELIEKNSTNGFLEPKFQKWLNENSNINNFIIVGDCTDICIQQLSVTLKAEFNRKNKSSRVIVPINLVETYDLDLHNADLLNSMMLYNMSLNGVEVVSYIRY